MTGFYKVVLVNIITDESGNAIDMVANMKIDAIGSSISFMSKKVGCVPI